MKSHVVFKRASILLVTFVLFTFSAALFAQALTPKESLGKFLFFDKISY